MDRLEVQGEAPATFPDFEHMFIDQYAPLDDKNIAKINYESCNSVEP